MPWQHCGKSVNDDQRCPDCGVSKGAWTVKLRRTLLLVIGSKGQDQAEALKSASENGTPFCEKCEGKA